MACRKVAATARSVSSGFGGGISTTGGDLADLANGIELRNVTISGNQAKPNGSAIAVGGGIHQQLSFVRLIHVTLTENTATGAGGGGGRRYGADRGARSATGPCRITACPRTPARGVGLRRGLAAGPEGQQGARAGGGVELVVVERERDLGLAAESGPLRLLPAGPTRWRTGPPRSSPP